MSQHDPNGQTLPLSDGSYPRHQKIDVLVQAKAESVGFSSRDMDLRDAIQP
jgi:hypothetical protein